MLILLAVDGSELALDAVRHVVRLAHEGLRVSVVLANAQEAPHLYEVVLAPDAGVLESASEGAGRHALQTARHLLDAAGIPCIDEVAHGEPDRVLLEIVERHGCDAIVLGAGHEGALVPGRLGPVAQAVLHHAGVPVTIVRHVDAEGFPDDGEAADSD
jgi:nucleotide-binding universal stress UspA family protein